MLDQEDDIEIDGYDEMEYTPLHYAAQGGYLEITELLLETGQCNVNCADDSGNTPLHFAIGAHQEFEIRRSSRFTAFNSFVSQCAECGDQTIWRAN